MIVSVEAAKVNAVAINLRRLAKETRDTAVGSSRVDMYEHIATAIEAEANNLALAIKS